jgi:Ni/Fe-hydrogenase subunit HybB-like protein
MGKRIVYREWLIKPEHYWGLLAALAGVIAIGGAAALFMEHEGHWVTGMTNSVVWGLPHVFAVFLIVAASGALNVASIGTVFNNPSYKPLGRLSGLLAAALLVAGLLVLVLDLGRPDRLIVAMTTYNFTSIFAWNIFLYTGFLVVTIAYLWTMAERKANHLQKPVGTFAFLWRLALTTGTGSIFGFLVGRSAYDTAMLAPMFVVMSFAYGLAIYMLVLMASFDWDGRPIGPAMLKRLKNLLGIFIGAVLYFTLVYHLTNLYGAKNTDLEAFILINGGIYTMLFWGGWVLIGGLLPLGIIYHPELSKDRNWIATACGLTVVGGTGGDVRHHHR